MHSDIDTLFETEDQQLLSEPDKIVPTEEEMVKRLPFFKTYWAKMLGLGGAGLFLLWLILEALKGFSGPENVTAQVTEPPSNQAEMDALRQERDNLQGAIAVQGQRQTIPIPHAQSQERSTQQQRKPQQSVPVSQNRVVQTTAPNRIPAPPVQSAAPPVVNRTPTRQAVSPTPVAAAPPRPASRASVTSRAVPQKPDADEMWNKLASSNTFTGSTDSIKSSYRKTPLTTPPPPPVVPTPIRSQPIAPAIPLGTKARGELLTPLAWTSGSAPNQNALITLLDDFGPHKKGSLVSASVASVSNQIISLAADSISSNGRSTSLSGIQVSASNGKPLIAKAKRSGGNGLGRDILNGLIGVGSGALSDLANNNNQTISFGRSGQVSSINTGGNNGLLGAVANSAGDIAGSRLNRNQRPRQVEYFYLKEGTTVELMSIR